MQAGNIHEILKHYWGYDSFRPLQEKIITAVLNGNDTLALLPTGGGKSICFQVPALAKPGLCLVVSPLIALMKDQVENLVKRGIEAKALYSGMSYREIDLTLDNCIHNPEIKFLYVSPERLKTEMFRERLKQMNIKLLAVDEAHCISQWGYDFRPEYRQIAEARELLGTIPVMALTATATQIVAIDIMEQLRFRKKNLLRKSFERKNLRYVVRYTEDKQSKALDVVSKVEGSSLIYTRSRKETENLAAFMKSKGIKADFYHAGLNAETRSRKQEGWIQNQTRLMICTNAFGMGIDKPDCRLVLHMAMPDCPEAYYQEAGRAGRDGKTAYCVLLYSPADATEAQERLKQNFPEETELRRVYQALCDYYQVPLGAPADTTYDFDLVDFCKRYKLKPALALPCLNILEQADLITLSDSFYEPSRLRFLYRNEELYTFQVENETFDPFIKLLLRTYGGLFDSYVNINEKELASRFKCEPKKTVELLSKLSKLGVLDYREQKECVRMNFVQHRLAADAIRFDKALLETRKKMAFSRLNAMTDYARGPEHCRSLHLLEYFDEFGTEACGVCDVCTEKRKQQIGKDEFENLKTAIERELKQQPLSLTQLSEKCHAAEQHTFAAVVRLLLDNDTLRYDNNTLLNWAGN